jgi:AraC-like DNA-binding protein/ligand-binding sensor protein
LNANAQLIQIVARSSTFQNYERAYVETAGMPVALRPVESWQLPFRGRSKENNFCALMAAQAHACAACLQLQAKLTRAARHQPATRTCAYGLCETAVPVKLGPETIGFLQTGQVLRRPPDEASFQRAVSHARKLGVAIGGDATRLAYFSTPVITQRKLAAAADLLAIFAEHLAIKANAIMVQAVNVEPPFITQAKRFIQEHCTENLSLGQVARVANTSRFYFCKQFRKVTGMSFTEFVSRTRIEKAKNFLLNGNLRVSEVAFAAGFQSLTHFNRVFKQVAGQSPTGYRDNLSALKARKEAFAR